MAIAISTIGTQVSYAIETTAGTRPTTATNYTRIPGVKSIPDMNPQPDTLETTSLDNLEYKTYIPGLKDLGGVLDFTVNLTQDLFDLWETASTGVMALYETAKAGGKAMWLCINIAGLDESCYLSVEPSHIGLPAGDTNSVYEATLHFTPIGEPIWAADPTTSSSD